MPETAQRVRVVHCLNQFFAGIGGEEAADQLPVWFDGARGPGRLLEHLAPDFEIVGTVAFGDNYVARDVETGAAEVIKRIREHSDADLLIAGPAFQAGRYGLACGEICRAARNSLQIPSATAMHPENPGVDPYSGDVVIVRAAQDVAGMNEALERLVRVGRKLLRDENLDPEADELLISGRRRNLSVQIAGAQRAVDMLVAKIRTEPFVTEYAMPVFDRVPPAPPLRDPALAHIALVTSGGIVPRGNPDRIESANAQRWGVYDITGLDALTPASHETVHGGYDPTYANQDPNRVLPLDSARTLEGEGRIGRLHDRYYATVGNATEVAQAQRFGREMAARLLADGVHAVVLTST